MRTIARFMDARNTAEGKFLSVLLSVLLVFSFLNVTMFTDYAGADTTPEGDGTEIVTPLEDVDEPGAQPEDEADGPESEEPAEEVNETDPAAEPEAPVVAEDEESYPAQRLTAVADDGAIVVVDAPEGALAAGSSAKAKTVASKSVEDAIEEAVAEDGKELQEMAAYDITIHDAEGNEMEPLKTVGVSIKGVGVEGEGLTIFHVADNGDVERVADITPTAAVEFDAESFSIYVVAGADKVMDDQTPITYAASPSNIVLSPGQSYTIESDNEDYATWQIATGSDENGDFKDWKTSSYDSYGATLKSKDDDKVTVVIGSNVPDGSKFVVRHRTGGKKGNLKYEHFYITVKAQVSTKATVSFEANGAMGKVPDPIADEIGEVVTLPLPENLTKNNFEFVGWSTSANGGVVSSGTAPAIYPAGSEYEITKNETLYAIWAQNAGWLDETIVVALRNDGNIPNEPSLNYDDVYTFLVDQNDHKTNVLAWINPAVTTASSQGVDNLTQTFYDEMDRLNQNNRYWNSETQYVVWYVVKFQDNKEVHIDGVVRDKTKVTLDYDANGGTPTTALPSGTQAAKGAILTVSEPENRSDPKDPNTLVRLAKPGYNFTGWNTKADGTGLRRESWTKTILCC